MITSQMPGWFWAIPIFLLVMVLLIPVWGEYWVRKDKKPSGEE